MIQLNQRYWESGKQSNRLWPMLFYLGGGGGGPGLLEEVFKNSCMGFYGVFS